MSELFISSIAPVIPIRTHETTVAIAPPHRHIAGLDGLRGLAILFVMAYHYMGFGPHENPLIRWFFAFNRSGWMGVDLFFVISGFLVTGILLDAKGTPHFFRNFYMRRTLRIFPLYYAVLFLLFTLPLMIPALATAEFQNVASKQAWLWLYGTNILNSIQNKLVFTGGWLEANHFWSLAVEEQFYLIWPPLVYFLSGRSIVKTCLVMLVAAPALRVAIVTSGHAGLAPYMLTPCRIDTMAIGALLAVIYRQRPSDAWLCRLAMIVMIVTGAFLVAAFCTLGGIEHGNPLVQTAGFSVIAIFSGALVILSACLPRQHGMSRLLNLPILRSIGKYSYGIYVFHWLLYPILFQKLLPEKWIYAHLRYVPGAILRYIAMVGMSYAIAWISWHAFEKHFLKLKRLFSYRPVKQDRDTLVPSSELASAARL